MNKIDKRQRMKWSYKSHSFLSPWAPPFSVLTSSVKPIFTLFYTRIGPFFLPTKKKKPKRMKTFCKSWSLSFSLEHFSQAHHPLKMYTGQDRRAQAKPLLALHSWLLNPSTHQQPPSDHDQLQPHAFAQFLLYPRVKHQAWRICTPSPGLRLGQTHNWISSSPIKHAHPNR